MYKNFLIILIIFDFLLILLRIKTKYKKIILFNFFFSNILWEQHSLNIEINGK